MAPNTFWVPNLLSPSVGAKNSLELLAKELGWLVRKERKLHPLHLIQALVACVGSGYCSLRQIAISVGLLTGSTVSKPSVHARLNESFVCLLKEFVAHHLQLAIESVESFSCRRLAGIQRVLVGDSSVLTLHKSLMAEFPGSSNQHGVKPRSVVFSSPLIFSVVAG